MKKRWFHRYIFAGLTIVCLLLNVACSNINEGISNTESASPTKAVDVTSKTDDVVNDNDIKEFISDFVKATSETNVEEFKSLMDEYGMYSITYFVDKRDRNVVLHLNRDEIRSDLVLANSKKVGISLGGAYKDLNVDDIPIQESDESSKISFNIDWHINDENIIESNLEDIISTCQKINIINNEYIPQIFVLNDNLYAFCKSSGVEEPEPEFTGDWLIFEKRDDAYKIRAFIELQ